MAKRYERVLFATDFSPGSQAALKQLERLAGDRPMRVAVLHVLEPVPFATPPAPVLTFARARQEGAQRALVRLTDGMARRLGRNVRLETHVSEGVPHVEICRVAASLRVDLIVIGTHGRTGLPHVLVGSVAERVVRHAGRPVLTVPLQGARGRRR